MKGAIFKGISDLVRTSYGEEIWDRIRRTAECSDPVFVVHQDYPDVLAPRLIVAAATELEIDPHDVMVAVGRSWLTTTGQKTYPSLFAIAGNDVREFLMGIHRVHAFATRGTADASPPRFEYEEIDADRLRVHYFSERALCSLLEGIILGAGDHFGERLAVRQTACVATGAPHCTMEVTFG